MAVAKGFNYGIDPQNTNPFWKDPEGGSGDVSLNTNYANFEGLEGGEPDPISRRSGFSINVDEDGQTVRDVVFIKAYEDEEKRYQCGTFLEMDDGSGEGTIDKVYVPNMTSIQTINRPSSMDYLIGSGKVHLAELMSQMNVGEMVAIRHSGAEVKWDDDTLPAFEVFSNCSAVYQEKAAILDTTQEQATTQNSVFSKSTGNNTTSVKTPYNTDGTNGSVSIYQLVEVFATNENEFSDDAVKALIPIASFSVNLGLNGLEINRYVGKSILSLENYKVKNAAGSNVLIQSKGNHLKYGYFNEPIFYHIGNQGIGRVIARADGYNFPGYYRDGSNGIAYMGESPTEVVNPGFVMTDDTTKQLCLTGVTGMFLIGRGATFFTQPMWT